MGFNIIYSIICLIASIINFSFMTLAFIHYRDKSYAKPFGLLTFAVGVYCFAHAFEIMKGDPEWTFLWLRVEYFGLSFISACWLWFSLDFTGNSRFLKPCFFYTIFGLSFFFLLVVLTNNLHHLYYTYIDIDTSGPFEAAKLGKGILYKLNNLWLFSSIFISSVLYITRYIKTKSIVKRQLLIMFIGSAISIIGVSVYSAKLIPGSIDIGPIIITINSCILGLGILRISLLDVSPIAKDRIFESMIEGIIITDSNNVILDFNPSAQRLIPKLSKEKIGKDLFEIIPEFSSYKSSGEIEVITLKIGDSIYFCEIRTFPITNRYNKKIGVAWHIRDVTEKHILSEQIKNYAEKDSLTGIWNRRKWIEIAKMEVLMASRYKRPLTIMSIDLDHFKMVNDTMGHEVGDKVLIEVTQILLSKIRSIDILGRIGGEEFSITFPETNKEQALIIANRILTSVSSHKFRINENEFSITVSIGIAAYDGNSDITLEKLMKGADDGLYKAKRTGKNKACFAD